MKKNVLALSIATMIGGLGFSSVASAALTVNESGTGHILVVPYFTAQGGNATGIHLTNTDMTNAKAVKVRIRGASNSDDLLDFQVFLSPGDVWTASISADEDGLAQLTTNDTSCTVPVEVRTEKTTKFGKSRLKAGADNAETREGYIEILNMADIKPGANTSWKVLTAPTATAGGTPGTPGAQESANKDGNSALYTAIKHVSKTAPCTTTVIDALEAIDPLYNNTTAAAAVVADGPAVTRGTTAFATAHGMSVPTGGLSANWYVINVANSTTFSGAATAIRASAPANVLYSPQLPTTKATTNLFTADPLMVSGVLEAVPYDLPDLSTPLEVPFDTAGTAAATTANQTAASKQARELTQALSASSVANQYLVDSDLGASTDWVLSMPTRRYIVAANYSAEKTDTYGLAQGITGVPGLIKGVAGQFSEAVEVTSSIKKTTKAYRIFNLASNTPNAVEIDGSAVAGAITAFGKAASNTSVNSKGQICVTSTKQTFLDNEESQKAGSGAVVSPLPDVVDLKACGEVSVVTLGTAATAPSVVSASVAHSNVVPGYLGGWGSFEFATGVPVLGSAFIKAVNADASAGMMGNYGLTWAHTYK